MGCTALPGAAEHAACSCSDRPLRVLDNFQGWGNRIGWWLTAAALGEALQRPVVTGWHGAPKTSGGRNYDYYEVRRLVQLPHRLHYLEDTISANHSRHHRRAVHAPLRATVGPPLSGSAFRHAFRNLDADEIPLHPKPYVNDYIAEPAYEMITSWGRRGLFPLPACLTRSAFLSAFLRVGAQLQPSADVAACLPPRGSYLALHVRRGDKAAAISKAVAGGKTRRATARARPPGSADLFDDTRTWSALGQVTKGAPSLPWLVVSDSTATRNEAAKRLRDAGASEVRLRCIPRASPDNRHRPLANMTAAVLTDFFALGNAAGVVAIAPNSVNQGLAESSFATVAALAADLPHLTPAPFSEAGKMGAYEMHGNHGRPMRGVFFLDDLERYVQALTDPRVRHRRELPLAERAGGRA